MPRRRRDRAAKHYVKAKSAPFPGPSKGVKSAIGPYSWRSLFVKGNSTKPMVGSGKGAPQIARSGVGPQTIKRAGPVIF